MALRAGSYYISPAVHLAIHRLCFPCFTAHCKYKEKSFSLPREHLETIIINPCGSTVALCRALASGHARTLCLIKAHIIHPPSSLWVCSVQEILVWKSQGCVPKCVENPFHRGICSRVFQLLCGQGCVTASDPQGPALSPWQLSPAHQLLLYHQGLKEVSGELIWNSFLMEIRL